jgi:uncharacterized membrane protein HdeD (DUF308 family)
MATYPVDDLPAGAEQTAFDVSGFGWMWLVSGTLWIIAALVVLQFDKASVATVGVIVGLMFLFAAVQQFILVWAADGWVRWVSLFFAVLLLVAGVIAIVNPKNTFAGIADILGFLFLIVATMWIVRSFVDRESHDLWWLGLISGILMLILAFWTSGQFFIEKAYMLLVFAGIWGLMQGVTDIVRAFAARAVHKELG